LTKRISKTNVIQMPKKKSSESKDEQLYLAQNKVYDAWESIGKRRVKLAREALAISEDCADAYIVLAEKLKNGKQRIPLYREAVAAGERALGADWKTKYKGACWGTLETRPVMRALAKLRRTAIYGGTPKAPRNGWRTHSPSICGSPLTIGTLLKLFYWR
jgi:hypothetical protein